MWNFVQKIWQRSFESNKISTVRGLSESEALCAKNRERHLDLQLRGTRVAEYLVAGTQELEEALEIEGTLAEVLQRESQWVEEGEGRLWQLT